MDKTQINLMLAKCLIALSIFCVAQASQAQYLLSSEFIGQMSKQQIENQYGQEVRTGVSLYRVTYMTVGTQGQTDTASGLIVKPDTFLVQEIPVVAYQHGTTNGPQSVPSLLTAGHDIPIVYGGMGYVASAADYLGLGTSRGFHPYIHAATEASAGLDMLIATTEFLEDETGQPWVGPLFISGYSQGGHAAAALQRELEQNWSFVFPVTASTPMSGPYDVSGVMYDRITSDAIYFFPAYIAYITLGYQEIYGNLYDDIGDIFKAQYVGQIEQFRQGQITTFNLNTFMINRLIIDNTLVQPIKMMRDSIVNILRTDTLDHPIKDAIRDNDVHDWAPQAPTRLLYCEADEQVPFMNSIVADSAMNANGAADVKSMNIASNQNHAGCAPLAVEESIRFFDSFLLTSKTDDTRAELADLTVFPNPANGQIHIQTGLQQAFELRISDLQGRTLIRNHLNTNGQIGVEGLRPGVYILQVTSETHAGVRKITVE